MNHEGFAVKNSKYLLNHIIIKNGELNNMQVNKNSITKQSQINQINSQINKVCAEKPIKCLHAIESGSRAWGFASPDSDYDVRLIYQREPDWYLRLFAGRDTFEYIQNDLFEVPFDIGGWDIRKALTLMYKSNAVIFEWLNSPIVYQSDEQFVSMIQAVQHEFFDARALFYHYRGMAKNANSSLTNTSNNANSSFIIDEPIKLKKWFYLLRALLASVWTLTKKMHPPVVMSDMFGLLTESERQETADLIAIKQQVDESHLQQLPESLQTLTERLWQQGNELIANNAFPDKHQGDIALLDDIFKKVVFDK